MENKAKDRGERKQSIIEAAQRLFSEKGYIGVSVRELADAVGLETSSIYSHFEAKEDILWDIALHCASDFNKTIKPIFDSELNTKSKLKEMIVAHVNVTLENRQAAAVFVSEWRHLTEPRRSNYSYMRNTYEQMFREVIADGVKENLLRQIDEKFAALTILSALNWTYQWYNPERESSPIEIGDALSELLLNGLVRSI